MARAPYVTIAQDPLALSAPQLLDGLQQLLPAAVLNCAPAHLYPMPPGSSLGSTRKAIKRRQFLTQSRNMVTFIPMGDVGIRKVEERLDDILWGRNRASCRCGATGPAMIITPYS